MMVRGPKLNQLKLKPCCRRSIKEIREKIRKRKRIVQAIAYEPFFNKITVKPSPTEVTTEKKSWKIWARAAQRIEPISKGRCKYYAQMEKNKHSGELGRFWEAMHESFS